MTDTTTAEQHAAAMLGPDPSRGGELVAAESSDLAIQPGQSAWNPAQLAVLRQIGIEDAEQADIDLFFHVCKMSGLDPFRREIYMIGRKTKVNVREVNPDTGNERTVEQYVMKFTIQTGINGFRKRAREIAEQKGIKIGFEGPLWCGDDGVWRDVWPEGKHPLAAKFIVFRDGEPISFVAHYAEYVQEAGAGANRGPNSMWAKMPANQTGKCAEAGAIQRAFPDELGGLLLEDAVRGDVIDSHGNVVAAAARREPTRARGVTALAQRVAPQVVDAEPDEAVSNTIEEGRAADAAARERVAAAAAIFTKATRSKWEKSLEKLLAEADCPDVEDQLIVVTALAGRMPDDRPTAPAALPDAELKTAVEALDAARKDGTLGQVVTDLINTDIQRQANAAEQAGES